MANKLKNMRLTSVDLVRNGANQEADICLFKSADPEEDTAQPTTEEKNIFKRFINWLRENPTEKAGEPVTPETVEKDYTTFDSLTAARENNEKLWQYTSALTESIQSIQRDQDLDKNQKLQMMLQSLEQFDAAMEKLLEALCNATPPTGLAKSDEEDMSYLFEGLEKSTPEEEEDNFEDDEIDEIEEVEAVQKFNPYHGSDGRFANANGGGKFYATPGKSKAHDLAIQREKDRQSVAGGSASADKDPFSLDSDDDDLMPWANTSSTASGNTSGSQKPQSGASNDAKSGQKESTKNPIPNVPIDTSSYSWFKHGKEPSGVGYYSYEVTHGKNKLSTYNFHGDYHEGLKKVAEKFKDVSHISVGV